MKYKIYFPLTDSWYVPSGEDAYDEMHAIAFDTEDSLPAGLWNRPAKIIPIEEVKQTKDRVETFSADNVYMLQANIQAFLTPSPGKVIAICYSSHALNAGYENFSALIHYQSTT